MSNDAAQQLVQFIARHMERESRFLQPDPAVIMRDPYGLLDLVRGLAQIDAETIDAWMVAAQGAAS